MEGDLTWGDEHIIHSGTIPKFQWLKITHVYFLVSVHVYHGAAWGALYCLSKTQAGEQPPSGTLQW